MRHLGVNFGSLNRGFPGKFRAEFLSRDAIAALRSGGLDIRRHFRRRLHRAVEPRPNMALTYRLAGAFSQNPGERGLSVNYGNRLFECFGAHGGNLTTLVVK